MEADQITRRVRINTVVAGHTIEGTLLVADPVTSLAVVDTTPEAPTRDLHVITISNIQDFQILSISDKKEGDEASASGAEAGLPPVTKIDIAALRAREEAAIRKVKERDAQRGKGVTKEAQEIFDWFART
jgi:protein LSM12